MGRIARRLFAIIASSLWGVAALPFTATAVRAQVGPFEKFVGGQLSPTDMAVVALAIAVTVAIAAYEFARDEVTVLQAPTMPKYTVPWTTYLSFSAIYVAIIVMIFGVVMEKYEVLRQLMIPHFGFVENLPDGNDILTISVGSVVLIAAFHYLHIPNTHIGPSWLLFRLRRLLHRRARIPEEAQVLARHFLSDDPALFTVPPERHEEVAAHPRVSAVTPADFRAAQESIDYQWAVVSYLYTIGTSYETLAPYSSFISNEASRWPEIVQAYDRLSERVALVKSGTGDAVTQREVHETVQKLRTNLSIFHACLHLFAISNEAERAARLKAIGLRQHAIFFLISRSLLSKLLVFIICGIAAPPLAFGLFAMLTGSETFRQFAEPALIVKWVLFGAPMYLLPIAMVLGMKRLMRTAWPIRATRHCVSENPRLRRQADFKWDIYLLIFGLSCGVGALVLLVYNLTVGPAPYYFALAPAATATSLAVLIDCDVVDRGSAQPVNRPYRSQVLLARAAGLAILLGGIISYLAATLTDASVASLTVYAVTAAFMGVMIGMQTDFHRNVRIVN